MLWLGLAAYAQGLAEDPAGNVIWSCGPARWCLLERGTWRVLSESPFPGVAVIPLPDGSSVRISKERVTAAGPDGQPRWSHPLGQARVRRVELASGQPRVILSDGAVLPDAPAPPLFVPGRDLTGDGVPELWRDEVYDGASRRPLPRGERPGPWSVREDGWIREGEGKLELVPFGGPAEWRREGARIWRDAALLRKETPVPAGPCKEDRAPMADAPPLDLDGDGTGDLAEESGGFHSAVYGRCEGGWVYLGRHGEPVRLPGEPATMWSGGRRYVFFEGRWWMRGPLPPRPSGRGRPQSPWLWATRTDPVDQDIPDADRVVRVGQHLVTGAGQVLKLDGTPVAYHGRALLGVAGDDLLLEVDGAVERRTLAGETVWRTKRLWEGLKVGVGRVSGDALYAGASAQSASAPWEVGARDIVRIALATGEIVPEEPATVQVVHDEGSVGLWLAPRGASLGAHGGFDLGEDGVSWEGDQVLGIATADGTDWIEVPELEAVKAIGFDTVDRCILAVIKGKWGCLGAKGWVWSAPAQSHPWWAQRLPEGGTVWVENSGLTVLGPRGQGRASLEMEFRSGSALPLLTDLDGDGWPELVVGRDGVTWARTLPRP